ncbi:MAG: twin-arginine translocation pathway signal [Candidatus Solibacter sp.]|jgi:protein-disulfide isomerase|nr:twin-arginine translocation pathway signal [Candidatus Solibacter sp.]
MKILALALALLLPCVAAGPEVDKNRTMGNPSAPLMFELYSDFMCPHCKLLHENILPSIILDYVKTGKAYLIFREYPLQIPQHVYSRPAAALAVAAGRVGKYQAASDALFKQQNSWGMTGKLWDAVAPVLTPDEQTKVKALSQDPTILAEVQKDVDRGMAAMVNETPTLMITYKLKQQPWSKWADYSFFRSYVDGLLKK